MIGKEFGRLTVVARGRSDSKHLFWHCRCSCGTMTEVRTDHLRLRLTRSCGCLHHQVMLARGHHYERGKKFGRLTVLKELAGKPRRFFCRCSCGNHVAVRGDHLAGGVTRSCGCWFRRTRNWRHGKAPASHKIPVYSCYIREKGWCENPTDRHWEYYGGKGVLFLFPDFQTFFDEVGDKPNDSSWLMRKNSDGNFEPGNLAWVERKRVRK
jgi:hypothetical protein